MHVHDRLHVSMVELRDRSSVQARVLRSLELVLVDVAVEIADGGGNGSFRNQLANGDHLGTQVNKCLGISSLEKIARPSTEESCFVEGNRVQEELLEAKVGQERHECLGDVCVLEVTLRDLCLGCLIHNVDQVQLCHSVHFNGKQFILL